ncbi:50S ribosomal protein L25/general stress protein Ctc [Aestuariimicrobium ganziense]|uniref:50S ribosomal protein L25/general stress protein Ctc n=1 Tax=Aestuariimicrobium ganziense TaxID=2773677 RepID=UPI001940B040|nr:50S ribosomal protein L25/general stress protein Ctc [Aestuariimicrobium ganziense]
MAEIKLNAAARSEFGKGAARRLRRSGQVPAVLYGHGAEPVHVALPGHDTLLALRAANALLDITIDGGKSQLALPKQVQRDPVRNTIEHVDLIIVRRGEKVTVDVPVTVTGEAEADALVVQELNSLSVLAEATHIPSEIVLSIEGATVGTQFHAGAIELPEGVELNTDAEALVVNVSAAATAEELEAALAGDGEGAEAAEDEDEAADSEDDEA